MMIEITPTMKSFSGDGEQMLPFRDFSRGIVAGMIGGLAATVAMDLFGAGIFTLLGWPANTSFSIIGDSAAAFFAILGIALTGGDQLGLQIYYLIGITLGAVFGTTILRLELVHRYSLKKKVGYSILFVEGVSLPLLAAGVWALKMSATSAVQWFSISFVMHLVFGLILGIVTSYGVSGAARYSLQEPR
jgi:hypothetical protein